MYDALSKGERLIGMAWQEKAGEVDTLPCSAVSNTPLGNPADREAVLPRL